MSVPLAGSGTDETSARALAALETVSMRRIDVPVGKVVYTPWLSPGGGFKADLTVMRLGADEFRVVTGGAHGMADRQTIEEWGMVSRMDTLQAAILSIKLSDQIEQLDELITAEGDGTQFH